MFGMSWADTLRIVLMGIFILVCIFLTIVVLMQESKQQGMTSAVTGNSNDSFYGKNSGRTKEARLAKFTTVAAVILFVVTIAVNLIFALKK